MKLLELMTHINPSKPSGHYMYRQFNIQQFYVLPTQCIYVFCVDLRTNSDYFPVQKHRRNIPPNHPDIRKIVSVFEVSQVWVVCYSGNR